MSEVESQPDRAALPIRTECPICASPAAPVARRQGQFAGREFELRRCPECRLSFVRDPVEDLSSVYDERYYAGEGADPLVDYAYELEHPSETIRVYEWRGIRRVVSDLLNGLTGVRWLDYGCGNGGLVRYLRQGAIDAVGFEEGAIVARATGFGIPIHSREELAGMQGEFDVVTAVEVLEHVLDPVAELRTMRSLLRDDGLLFLTTGNAKPFADRLGSWSYATPEIHISLFEPTSLDLALRKAGFRPEHSKLGPGFDDVLKFKVLKNLKIRRRSRWTDAVPARLLALPAERYSRLSEHPIGWALPSGTPT